MVIAQAEQRFDWFDDEAVDCLGALAARLGRQRPDRVGVADEGFESQRIHGELL
jgi:hypothetical protein